MIDPVKKGHNAERPLVAPLQGAGFGGAFTQGKLGLRPRLPWDSLGCPFRAPNGLNLRFGHGLF